MFSFSAFDGGPFTVDGVFDNTLRTGNAFTR